MSTLCIFFLSLCLPDAVAGNVLSRGKVKHKKKLSQPHKNQVLTEQLQFTTDTDQLSTLVLLTFNLEDVKMQAFNSNNANF